MDTLTVSVPETIRTKLDERARAEGKDAQAVALEILTRDLGTLQPEPPARFLPYDSEEAKRARVERKLREQGLIEPLGEDLEKMIIPGVDADKVFEEMGKVGGKPLSQIVIEQRQERHDILVYGYKRARQKIRARERKQSSQATRSRKRK